MTGKRFLFYGIVFFDIHPHGFRCRSLAFRSPSGCTRAALGFKDIWNIPSVCGLILGLLSISVLSSPYFVFVIWIVSK